VGEIERHRGRENRGERETGETDIQGETKRQTGERERDREGESETGKRDGRGSERERNGEREIQGVCVCV